MYWSELHVEVAHEHYNDLLAEACNERLIRAAKTASARPSGEAGRSTLIERIVAALRFRRVAQI